ncbi:hypothetical protein AA313_de0209752 [Arthrobotrys entomopaga]|nr:hypothetical protein AA313_de0209752 [Arthrobotrys entomopaga]
MTSMKQNSNPSTPRATKNLCLEALHDIFPEADIADLRYRINAKFQEHVELSEQLKMLLEQSQMGRKLKSRIGNDIKIQPWDRFRSRDYVKAVEFNLKSWRHKISSWIFPRPKSEESGAVPRLGPTGCRELDEELWELGRLGRVDQATSDLAVAQALNEKQYEEINGLLECECCFGDYTFEMMAACCQGHLFCHNCVANAAKEGLYGQTTSLVKEKGSIRCLSSIADPPCDGYLPLDLISQVLPEEILRAMEDKFIEDDIAHCGMPIAKCPFCTYAEVDEIPPWNLRKEAAYASVALSLFLASASVWIVMILLLGLIFAVSCIYLFQTIAASEPVYIETVVSLLVNKAVKKQYETKRSQMFQCRNSSSICGRKSCRNCGKEWKAFHRCFENEEEALRLCVENAMASAIKRTVFRMA